MQKLITLILLFPALLIAQPALIKDINPGSAHGFAEGSVSTLVSIPRVAYNDKIYFVANDGASGAELWVTDGSSSGTQLLKDINPGAAGSSIDKIVLFGGRMYFPANDGVNGTELWASDGTAAGTTMVSDGRPGVGSVFPSELTNVGNMLLYKGNAASGSSAALWKSDGTSAGTVVVKTIDDLSDYLGQFTPYNGKVYFSGGDGELWSTDGTPTGTALLKEIYPGFQSGYVHNLGVHYGMLYFSAVESNTNKNNPWISDGTAAGTKVIKVIGTGSDVFANSYTSFNGKVYFGAYYAFWVTDGTEAGTKQVKDIGLAFGQYDPGGMVVMGNYLYLPAKGTGGTELWRTDGTTAGTTIVKDISPFTIGGSPQEMVLDSSHAALFFRANDMSSNYELWRSDGTANGTKLVSELNPTASANPQAFTFLNDELYFVADDGAAGRELYKLSLISPTQAPVLKEALFVVSPNPVRDLLHIQINNKEIVQEHLFCTITDNMGRVCHAAPFTGASIPVSQWATGIYTVEINNGTARQVERIVLAR